MPRAHLRLRQTSDFPGNDFGPPFRGRPTTTVTTSSTLDLSSLISALTNSATSTGSEAPVATDSPVPDSTAFPIPVITTAAASYSASATTINLLPLPTDISSTTSSLQTLTNTPSPIVQGDQTTLPDTALLGQPTSTSSISDAETQSSSGVSGRLIPAVVIVPIVVVLFIFGIVFAARRRRRHRQHNDRVAAPGEMRQNDTASIGFLAAKKTNGVDQPNMSTRAAEFYKGGEQTLGGTRERRTSFSSFSFSSESPNLVSAGTAERSDGTSTRPSRPPRDAGYYTGLDRFSAGSSMLTKTEDRPPSYTSRNVSTHLKPRTRRMSAERPVSPPSSEDGNPFHDDGRVSPVDRVAGSSTSRDKDDGLRPSAPDRVPSSQSVTSTLYSSNASIHEAEPRRVSYHDALTKHISGRSTG